MNQIGKMVVTQAMVAAAAKFHPATVSLALRNASKIPPRTREHIQAVARRLGYSPNPLVSMLMSRVRRSDVGCRGTIAYLQTAPPGHPRLAGTIHRNFFDGAKRRAEELGYNLDEFYLGAEGMSGRRITAILRARNMAGVVIRHVPSRYCPGRRLLFDLGPFAVASIGVPLAEPQLHYVANDQYMRAILAARKLLALGYRRLGLVLMDTKFDDFMAHRCSAGYWALGKYIRELVALPVCQIREAEAPAFPVWLSDHRPEAILSNDSRVLELTRNAGYRVPEEIGFVHLDWVPKSQPAAGVNGNSERIGAAAVELVVSQIHRGETGPPTHAISHFVAGSWVPGATVREVGPALDLDSAFIRGFE